MKLGEMVYFRWYLSKYGDLTVTMLREGSGTFNEFSPVSGFRQGLGRYRFVPRDLLQDFERSNLHEASEYFPRLYL